MKHSIGLTITANTLTTIITVPEGYVAEVDMIYTHNESASNKHVSIYWQHAHNPAHQIYVLYQHIVSSKDYYKFDNGSIVLQAGDTLNILTETGSTYSVIATFDLRKEKPLYTFLNA